MKSFAVLLITMGIMITMFTGFNGMNKNEIDPVEIVSQQRCGYM